MMAPYEPFQPKWIPQASLVLGVFHCGHLSVNLHWLCQFSAPVDLLSGHLCSGTSGTNGTIREAGALDQFSRTVHRSEKCPSPKQPAEGSVMIMYGNGSTATGSAHYADEIQDVAAFDVFILEYPGYEDRPGCPSQRSLFQAADEALRLISTNRPIYLVGESLGTGVASHLAATDSNAIGHGFDLAVRQFDGRCAVSLSAAAGPTVAGGPFSLGEIPPTLSWPARRGRWRSRYRRTGKVRSASLP